MNSREILFHPLYMKLGLTKQFLNALDKGGGCPTTLYLEKINVYAFIGLQIQHVIGKERTTSTSLVAVWENFLQNKKVFNY